MRETLTTVSPPARPIRLTGVSLFFRRSLLRRIDAALAATLADTPLGGVCQPSEGKVNTAMVFTFTLHQVTRLYERRTSSRRWAALGTVREANTFRDDFCPMLGLICFQTYSWKQSYKIIIRITSCHILEFSEAVDRQSGVS